MVSQLVFFLEEPSAREMLKGILPRLLPESINPRYVVFEGKQDLEKQLYRKLRAWNIRDAKFVILRDKDSANCNLIKANLVKICQKANKPDTLIRIACHELESFYLGDLSAVAKGIGPANLAKQQNKSKFRNPDRLANPLQELKYLAPEYQKLSGSRAIGRCLDIENNCSLSFNTLVNGVRRLIVNI